MNALSIAISMVISVSCFAGTNALEMAILSFPNIGVLEYRPDAAVDCANTLLAAGKNAACTALDNAARASHDLSKSYEFNAKVCHLCRLLFVPSNSTEFLRAPRIGVSHLVPVNSMITNDWPDMPFAIVSDVPLSMSLGGGGAGVAEPAGRYLTYCKANGVFRTELFPWPTSLTATNALNKLFNSTAWKSLKWTDKGIGWSYKLNEEYAKKMLWKQAENMVKEPNR